MICLNPYIFYSVIVFVIFFISFVAYKKADRLKRKERKRYSIGNTSLGFRSGGDVEDLGHSIGDEKEEGCEKNNGPDDFHSGRFHFEDNFEGGLVNKIKYALAKNDQDELHNNLLKIDGAIDKKIPKNKKIKNGDIIKIGFFCDYMDSAIFLNTISVYNKYFDKIRWVGCTMQGDLVSSKISCPLIFFSNVDDAVEYANQNFDFVIDGNFLLRPRNFYKILKRTTCYTINYYNFSCSSYNNYLDAFVVVDGPKVSKYKPSEKVISLPAQGSWVLEEQKEFSDKYEYDIAFIGEQFKYGENFFNTYKNLSDKFKIVFMGLVDKKYFKEHLKRFNWSTRNISFQDRINSSGDFRYFLTKCRVVVDTVDYSGGSSTLYALRSGTPVLTLGGEYLLDGMTAAFLEEMGLKELCFNNVKEMAQFIKSKNDQEFKKYSRYISKKTSDSLYFNPDKFLPLFYDGLIKSFGEE